MFPGRFRRQVGNVPLNIRKPQEVQRIRKQLLASQWFRDVGPDATVTHIPGGKRFLPILPPNVGAPALEEMLRELGQGLTDEAKAAIRTYIGACGVDMKRDELAKPLELPAQGN